MAIDIIERGLKSDLISKLASEAGQAPPSSTFILLPSEKGLAAHHWRGDQFGAGHVIPSPNWFAEQQETLILLPLQTITNDSLIPAAISLTGQKKGILQAVVTAVAGTRPTFRVNLQAHSRGQSLIIAGLGIIAAVGLYQLPVQFAGDAISARLLFGAGSTSITLEISMLLRGIG